MTTLRNLKPWRKSSATMANINPFPSRVARTLNTTAGNPRLIKPPKKPLVSGIILQGPVCRNLDMPNPPLMNEDTNVMINVVCKCLNLFEFDIAKHIRI